MNYACDWRDRLRHLSNALFVLSYLCFERHLVLMGAAATLAAESCLMPSAIKQRSWSTYLVGGVFIMLSLGTLTKGLIL